MTSPPSPPSPPDGPPRGTYFSRRKARQPLPPSPAFTRIVASSMNMRVLRFPLCTFVSFVGDEVQMPEPQRTRRNTKENGRVCNKKAPAKGEAVWRGRPRPRSDGETLFRGDGLDHHVLAKLPP